MSSENIVKLDVGGTVFKTSKLTLTKFDGMFKTMLETSVPVKKDESGSIFIDRSPKHFDLILNFMRDGEVELPDSEKKLKEIRKEAQFYLLTDLVELCSAKIPAKTEITNKIRVIKTESEYLQIVSNPIKTTLVFRYHVLPDETGAFPPEFDVSGFLEKHKNDLDIYFRIFTPSQEWGWVWTLHENGKTSQAGAVRKSNVALLETVEKDIEDFSKYGRCTPKIYR